MCRGREYGATPQLIERAAGNVALVFRDVRCGLLLVHGEEQEGGIVSSGETQGGAGVYVGNRDIHGA